MSSGPGSNPPGWRPPTSAAPPPPPGPAWAAPPPARPYRPRWWKLAAVAALGLLVLAAVVWVALWIRPPQPARLIVLSATYDTNLAVPVNPYGKAAAHDLAALTAPGGWFANRAKLNGTTEPGRLASGPLLPEIENTREKCVVVVLAAHGGRDRDGAFLFPDDATADPAQRIRVKAVLDRLAALPPDKQKLLILDATQSPAFPDLGLVHNDFAAALLDLESDVRAVPNLVVFASTGPDERSWTSSEWGTSAFGHFLTDGLNGAADADGDKRITGWELVEYVRPRVRDWVRDHRAARQIPVVLPRDEAESRLRPMHLAMTEGKPPAPTAPVPFDPPPEVEQLWTEYRELASGTPPPQAYTPHVWREYEAWLLRFEELTLAGDEDGARAVRSKAADARRRIEAARPLPVTPQTLALPVGVGGMRYYPEPPAPFRAGIASVADPKISAAERRQAWDKVKAVPGFDPATARILWGRALLKWVADDPPGNLPVVPEVLPLVSEGFALRPAELHFLAMLATHLPPPDKAARVVDVLREVLTLRWEAEAAAMSITGSRYPYIEFCLKWVIDEIERGDVERRQAEDLSFATDEKSWQWARERALAAREHYEWALRIAALIQERVWYQQLAAHRFPGFAEWLARDPATPPLPADLPRATAFQNELNLWWWIRRDVRKDEFPPRVAEQGGFADLPALVLVSGLGGLDERLRKDTDNLLAVRPEFEGKITPRAEAIRWFHTADAVRTAPPADGVSPTARRDLLREYRRVSRQLLVTGQTRPEPLPEVSEAVTRERAFDAARRRGQFQLARIGPEGFAKLAVGKPGESYDQVQFRLAEFAFRAEDRKSLAEASSRIGEILNAMPAAADVPGPNVEADLMLRLLPAYATPGIRNNPADQLRRQGAREVLAFQARRTVLDHWYDEAGGKYYLRAAVQLQSDARKVFPLADKQPDPFAELVRADEEAFPVQPLLPSRFVMTDEPQAELALDFTRHADGSGRPGFPVFWSEQPFPAKDAPAVPDRTPYGTEPGSPPTPFFRTIRRPTDPPPVTPIAQTGTIRVAGFYRGRTITHGVPLNAYPVPDQTAVNFPNPDPTVAIAVRADPALAATYGFGNGTVVIILDCSGSMRPAVPPKGPPPYSDDTLAVNAPNSRYAHAVEALWNVLNALPPGTVVTVRTFGRRSSGATTAEGSIQTLLEPTPLDFNRSKVIDFVMGRARGVTIGDLWHKSPVVRSVVDAKDWLREHVEYPGPFKSVVLISDEVDNRVTEDPRFAEPKREIRDILKAEFTDSGVYLGVVAVKVDTDAEKKVQAEFLAVKGFNPPGEVVPPEQAGELARWLRTGLLPRIRYTLEPTGFPDQKTELTAAAADPDNWFGRPLKPDRYVVRVSGSAKLAQEIDVRPGDRLWLELKEEEGKLQLTRRSFARWWPQRMAYADNTKWQMAVFQNWEKGGQLRIVAGIDDKPQPESTITQTDISDTWFKLSPDVANAAPLAVRWRPEPGFPGPCWVVTVRGGWPAAGKGPASPVLEAWWGGPQWVAAAARWVPPGRSRPVGIRNAWIAVDDVSVSLDSVAFERHVVEVAPDRFEERTCLVARLTHPSKNPVWVRPVGFVPAGSEVRFYDKADRVTCLYWWDETRADTTAVNAAITGFEVVSLQAVLADAVTRGRSLRLKNVPAPSDKSQPPVPPVQATPVRN
jgi:hypothetical protein